MRKVLTVTLCGNMIHPYQPETIMQDFNTIITKMAAIAKVSVIRTDAPKANRRGTVYLATAEDAQVFAVALNASKVDAEYVSFRGTHYVFIG